MLIADSYTGSKGCLFCARPIGRGSNYALLSIGDPGQADTVAHADCLAKHIHRVRRIQPRPAGGWRNGALYLGAAAKFNRHAS